MYKLFVIFLIVFLSYQTFAQPSTITYQGLLTDDNGDAITRTASIRMDIYDVENGGTSLWNETHSGVIVEKGLFTIDLNSINSDWNSIDFSKKLWLEITIAGNTLTPRIVFNSSSYAMASNKLFGAAGSVPYQTAEGTTAMLTAGTSGQVLTMNESATAPEWGKLWAKNDDDIYYSIGNVGIGSGNPDDLLIAPLNVDGGIRYFGNPIIADEPGVLFFDNTQPGSFKYFDNNGDTVVLGTGTIHYTNGAWSSANMDLFTFSYDVIITSSLGIGDINSGTEFGNSSLMIKDSIIRLLFDDTSISSPFPKNDWQITINDEADGGENYFAIDDITYSGTPFKMMASSTSNSLLIADYGDIGFGTDTPIKDLHIVSTNSPTIMLDQNNLGGFQPQKWEISGNDENFLIQDGNTENTPFIILQGAAQSTMVIAENGNSGFGVDAPARTVHISDVMKLEPSTEPASPTAGDIYFDSSLHKLRCFDGSQWQDVW